MPETDHWEKWKGLGDDLKMRIVGPTSQPTFIMYFLVVMLAVGGIGCWLTMFSKGFGTEAFSSLSTYSIAVLAAAMADVLLSQDVRQSFRMFSMGVLALGVVLAVLGLTTPSNYWTYASSMIAALLSWFLWYVANADNEKLKEPPASPTVTTGGDPAGTLTGTLRDLDLK